MLWKRVNKTLYALKMLFVMHWDFDTGSLNGNIFKVFFFQREGSQKGVLCACVS